MSTENQLLKRCRIGLFGHYGQNNLGDEAIVQASIQNLSERMPGIELVGLSIDPLDTSERHNIDSFPIRYQENFFTSAQTLSDGMIPNEEESSPKFRSRMKGLLPDRFKRSKTLVGLLHLLSNARSELFFLRRVRQQLKSLDVIIFCGSNQLEDTDLGPWGYPYTIFKWGFLARITGTKIFFVGVGAGPLSYPLSYWMLKQILFKAEYISFRDYGSFKMIQDHLPGIKGYVYPDLAHSLNLKLGNSGNNTGMQKTVAINPMPVFVGRYWYESDRGRYNTYVAHLAKLTIHILHRGFAIHFFNSHPSDLMVIDDLKGHLRELPEQYKNSIKDIRNKSIQEILDSISVADIIVATRFHSTVLPIHLAKPVLGICYQSKSIELLKDVGMGNYYVDINDFTGDELCRKFDSLVENLDDVKMELESQYERYAQMTKEQWNRVAYLIEGKALPESGDEKKSSSSVGQHSLTEI